MYQWCTSMGNEIYVTIISGIGQSMIGQWDEENKYKITTYDNGQEIYNVLLRLEITTIKLYDWSMSILIWSNVAVWCAIIIWILKKCTQLSHYGHSVVINQFSNFDLPFGIRIYPLSLAPSLCTTLISILFGSCVQSYNSLFIYFFFLRRLTLICAHTHYTLIFFKWD